jgi:hypothetical protein
MSKYPKLMEMGVQNPQQIDKFAIYTVGNKDVLRIIYNRKKGSLLPVSRLYKFEQVKNSVIVDSGTRQTNVIYESQPAFREALHELEMLKTEKSESKDLSAQINEELRLLEEDINLRIEFIRTLVGKS